jgi:hypothetical protein
MALISNCDQAAGIGRVIASIARVLVAAGTPVGYGAASHREMTIGRGTRTRVTPNSDTDLRPRANRQTPGTDRCRLGSGAAHSGVMTVERCRAVIGRRVLPKITIQNQSHRNGRDAMLRCARRGGTSSEIASLRGRSENDGRSSACFGQCIHSDAVASLGPAAPRSSTRPDFAPCPGNPRHEDHDQPAFCRCGTTSILPAPQSRGTSAESAT